MARAGAIIKQRLFSMAAFLVVLVGLENARRFKTQHLVMIRMRQFMQQHHRLLVDVARGDQVRYLRDVNALNEVG